jgi:hypothetical protein
MKKNVGSQVIGAQMVSATDGSAFTGSVTCSVTGDGGTQATGSVGSGACTHEGNGFHTYAPAQAETNYDHVAFTFTGTGAVPVTIQVYPAFPQTGDSYARLGAPAGASVSADIAAIEAQTDDIGVAGAGLTAIPWNASWDAEVQSECTDALTAYDPPTNAELAAEIDAVQADIAALNDVTAEAVADAVWDEATIGHTTAGTFGEQLKTDVDAILVDTSEIGAAGAGLTNINLPDQTMNITGNITGNLSGSVGSVTGNVGGNVVGSVGSLGAQAKLDVNAEADTALSDAALATAANLATVDTVVDAIQVVTDALGATAAARLQAAILTELIGTVDDTGFSPTTTEFEADDITEATADHFNGRIIIFTSGALQYQATDITDYALSSGRGHFTVTALTEAPANNATFIIV